mgnify:FL=1
MSRIVSVEGTGTERTRLVKSIVIALRELMKQKEVDAHSYDLAAYLALALRMIDKNVEKTVVAWEKKDYWLKADKFRMQWAWVSSSAEKIEKALQADDWAAIAMQAVTIAQKMNSTQVSEKHRLGTPWVGAWALLKRDLNK